MIIISNLISYSFNNFFQLNILLIHLKTSYIYFDGTFCKLFEHKIELLSMTGSLWLSLALSLAVLAQYQVSATSNLVCFYDSQGFQRQGKFFSIKYITFSNL